VQAFYAGSEPEYPSWTARLRQYQSKTDKLSVEFVDPFKHPARVKEMNISQSGPRIIVTNGQKEARAKETSEEALTNALIEVTGGSSKKVYFSKGHGEHASPTTPSAASSSSRQPQERGLPDRRDPRRRAQGDARRRAGAGDRRPVGSFTEGEVKLIKDWVEKGGKLVAMLDPGAQVGLRARSRAGASRWARRGDRSGSAEPGGGDRAELRGHPITQPRSSPFALATIFPWRARSPRRNRSLGLERDRAAKTGPRAWVRPAR